MSGYYGYEKEYASFEEFSKAVDEYIDYVIWIQKYIDFSDLMW